MSKSNDVFEYNDNVQPEIKRTNLIYTIEEMESFKKYKESKKSQAASTNLESKLSHEIIQDGNDFIFPNLYIEEGRYETIKLLGSPLENGAKKPFMKWWWVPQSQRAEKALVPNTAILYQMFHRAYTNRNNLAIQETIANFKNLAWSMFVVHLPYIGTYISYGSGFDATVRHVSIDGIASNKKITLPEFEVSFNDKWSYITLAEKQPDKNLGKTSEIPKDAKPFIEALFGQNYEDAGAVFQYLTEESAILPSFVIWVPTRKNRSDHTTLLFKLSKFDFQINIGIDRTEEKPAYGFIKHKL